VLYFVCYHRSYCFAGSTALPRHCSTKSLAPHTHYQFGILLVSHSTLYRSLARLTHYLFCTAERISFLYPFHVVGATQIQVCHSASRQLIFVLNGYLFCSLSIPFTICRLSSGRVAVCTVLLLLLEGSLTVGIQVVLLVSMVHLPFNHHS